MKLQQLFEKIPGRFRLTFPRKTKQFPKRHETVCKALFPLITLLSLYGFNLNSKWNVTAFVWRGFCCVLLSLSLLYHMYTLVTSTLDGLAPTSVLTAQISVLIHVINTNLTFYWMLRNFTRVQNCLTKLFHTWNYVWTFSSWSMYRKFRRQLIPCIISTLCMASTPLFILVVYYIDLSKRKPEAWLGERKILCRISDMIMCVFFSPFTFIVMGLYEGICCMISVILSEHLQNTRDNPEQPRYHKHYANHTLNTISPVTFMNGLLTHTGANNTNDSVVRWPTRGLGDFPSYNRDVPLSSLLEYHNYLANHIRQVDNMFGPINFIWYVSEVLQIILCIRAINFFGSLNPIYLMVGLVCCIPLVIRTMYAIKANEQAMKNLKRIFMNHVDFRNFALNDALQLQHYCLGLWMQPAQLTIFGLFTISWNLILTIGGTVLTYGIVLYGG